MVTCCELFFVEDFAIRNVTAQNLVRLPANCKIAAMYREMSYAAEKSARPLAEARLRVRPAWTKVILTIADK